MYEEINDYELLDKVSDDEIATEELFKKYKPLITSIAKKAFYKSKMNGLELNDLIQEGMIGFSIALNTYNEKREASFYTFARLCIIRRIVSSIQSYNRLKYQVLNESLSVDSITENVQDIERIFSDYESNPETMLITDEELKTKIKNINKGLTNFESEVFELKIAGFDYKEIAEILEKPVKSVDNAINRIKTKIHNYLKEKSVN